MVSSRLLVLTSSCSSCLLALSCSGPADGAPSSSQRSLRAFDCIHTGSTVIMKAVRPEPALLIFNTSNTFHHAQMSFSVSVHMMYENSHFSSNLTRNNYWQNKTWKLYWQMISSVLRAVRCERAFNVSLNVNYKIKLKHVIHVRLCNGWLWQISLESGQNLNSDVKVQIQFWVVNCCEAAFCITDSVSCCNSAAVNFLLTRSVSVFSSAPSSAAAAHHWLQISCYGSVWMGHVIRTAAELF